MDILPTPALRTPPGLRKLAPQTVNLPKGKRQLPHLPTCGPPLSLAGDLTTPRITGWHLLSSDLHDSSPSR